MKRDIQINYVVLDQIIEQLHTYKNAIHQMDDSLKIIAGYVENNEGKSLDAWDDRMQKSKKHIKSYENQIDDLLTLFENYVSDSTAYISPLSRNSMMRVDCNDIWWNLSQMESGLNSHLLRAKLETNKSPSFLFSMFDDVTPEEKERSSYNKQRIEGIRSDLNSTKRILEQKMESLWDLYDSKVKKFENVDDDYASKANAVKKTYTSFLEGVGDVVSGTAEGAWNFVKGLGVAIYEIAEGLISLVVDAGIIATSGIIPDSVEPEFIKNASTTRIETFNETLEQIIDDPIIVLESVAQSISDTTEKEGIMYVAGGAATSLIPYVGQTKYLKLLKVDKGTPIKSNGVSPSIAIKTKELVQNNKVFEGIKRETVQWYRDVKYSGNKLVQDVNHFLGRTLIPNHNLQVGMANQVPINVFSRSAVEDRIDSVVFRFDGKNQNKGTGDGTKGTGNSIQYAETGGRNISPEQFFKEEAIAEEMYEKFRNLGTEDVNAIAKNTGFSVARIQRIKDHVFNNSHIKDYGVGRFDPDYELAQAWQRLIDGKQVDSDIQLLHHEIFESKFEGIFQTNYRTAHDKTIESGRPWNWEKNYEE
ncbi:hypothetical protein [Bacillus sp. B1-b2]|uniref:hypothetical protein n=1 Tax=Bacillus sp. B1-b2 TaxID=2653201 RepID=UPI001D010E8E|nr:hypothetical protein [Bacillus sp. B1-b2]